MKVVALGEVLIQLNPVNMGPLRHINLFEKHVAGSEATVMIGMSRLGFSTEFLTIVGEDEFGRCITSTLNAEKVSTKFSKVMRDYPTGVYFLQRGFPIPGKTDVFYYRKGSAFSNLSPEDINPESFKDTVLFHTSGITPSLSHSCKLAALKAFKIAKENNIRVSFDTNIRKKLLPTSEMALETLEPFIKDANIIISGEGDLKFLFPNLDAKLQFNKFIELSSNAELIVIKMGKEGARVYNCRDKNTIYAPSYNVEVIDELGAGDAFDAAFLSSILLGKDLPEALKYANAAGAMVVGSIGDFESFPSWEELALFISFQKEGEKEIIR